MSRGGPRGGTAPGWLKGRSQRSSEGARALPPPRYGFQGAGALLSLGSALSKGAGGTLRYYAQGAAARKGTSWPHAARREVRVRRGARAQTPARTRRSCKGG